MNAPASGLRSAANRPCVVSDEQVISAYLANSRSMNAASKTLGITRASYRERLNRLRANGSLPELSPFTVDQAPPETDEPLDALIARRLADSERVRARMEHGDMHTIRIHESGPVGILHIGDPHLDDAGCDFAQLWHDLQLVRDTPGLFAGIIGDLHNNWVGRLARLYAQQNVSAHNAWRLVEAMIQLVGSRLLYLVAGNHDLWSGAGDPLKWIMRQHAAAFQPHGMRLRFTFPEGAEVRAALRHEWPGSSQYNPAFGQGKAAFRGLSDHIILGGHKHSTGYFTFFNEHTGILSHCLQVGSYKVLDEYAESRGFPRNNMTPSVLTIIDPTAERECERVLVFPSVSQGVKVLRALRS